MIETTSNMTLIQFLYLPLALATAFFPFYVFLGMSKHNKKVFNQGLYERPFTTLIVFYVRFVIIFYGLWFMAGIIIKVRKLLGYQ